MFRNHFPTEGGQNSWIHFSNKISLLYWRNVYYQ